MPSSWGAKRRKNACERAGLRPDEVDLIITVSCTGFMIPSLDAHLINLMGFRSNVRRMPFTELGCAAGAMALGRAADFLKAHPGGNVLIIAVELPSLTFQRKDISQANLISSILFGDGAAAVLVTGNSRYAGRRSWCPRPTRFPTRSAPWASIFAIPAFTSCSPKTFRK